MREEYYRYLGEIPPRQRSLSAIPAKYVMDTLFPTNTAARPERIIDTEIMEPSVASPRRSMGEKEKDKPADKPENAIEVSIYSLTTLITSRKKIELRMLILPSPLLFSYRLSKKRPKLKSNGVCNRNKQRTMVKNINSTRCLRKHKHNHNHSLHKRKRASKSSLYLCQLRSHTFQKSLSTYSPKKLTSQSLQVVAFFSDSANRR